MSDLYVLKADGKREIYSEQKIINSLKAINVSKDQQTDLLLNVKKRLYQNIKTAEIALEIERYLTETDSVFRAKYQLKKAVMTLGPTGYPFELYIGELLREYGYETSVGQLMRGRCVTHEVDVLAEKEKRVYFVECKYHNQPGMRSDLKVALYVYARGEDLKEKIQETAAEKEYQSWIFTNTKFSEDAISYAECQGMRLTGWGYPQVGSLQNMVKKKNLYPNTVLSSLDEPQKRRLMENNIVLTKQLENVPHLKTLLDLSNERLEKVKKECLLLGS